jgi:hypothetical protein
MRLNVRFAPGLLAFGLLGAVGLLHDAPAATEGSRDARMAAQAEDSQDECLVLGEAGDDDPCVAKLLVFAVFAEQAGQRTAPGTHCAFFLSTADAVSPRCGLFLRGPPLV